MKYFLLGLIAELSAFQLPVLAQNVIDVHSHIILPEYIEVLKQHNAQMEETFPLPDWTVADHLKFMQSAGIKTSVLTMPAPQPYYDNVEECSRIIRQVNEVSAKIKAEYPGRFLFCASLPLPDVNAAIREAVYALDTLKADGIKLATNSRGQYVGDEELEPLMKILDERNAIIILHPHKPVPVSDEIIQTAPLAVYEYPAETTRAVVNLIAKNVLVRYPDIKVIVPHCGSFLPLAIPRMKAVHQAMLSKKIMQPIDWEGNLSRLYYDLAGAPSAAIIKMMLTITTSDHIMYGSDYPYMPDAVLSGNLNRLTDALKMDSDLEPLVNGFLQDNAVNLFNQQ